MKSYSTTPFDRFNYIAQNYNSNALIQCVLNFDSLLDLDTLKCALSSCIVVDPILGCIWNQANALPEWQSISVDISSVCLFKKTNDIDSEISRFLTGKMDISKECPVKIVLITNNNKSVLVVKMHHALCDAGGVLQFVRLLSEMYSKAEIDFDFKPLKGEPQRNSDHFYQSFGINIENKAKYFDPSVLLPMESTWGTPFGDVEANQTFTFQKIIFEKSRFQQMKDFSKKHDCSINTVVTAAYHRALVELLKPSDSIKEIQFSANLRPYVKNQIPNTICNQSNMYNVQLSTQTNFDDLVETTKTSIAQILKPEYVLQSVLACELMSTDHKTFETFYENDWKNVKTTGLCTPMISNIGRLDDESISFGNRQATDMYIVPPAFIGPSFMLAVSTYNHVMTLSSSYYRPSTSDEFVNSLFNKMNQILDF